MFYSNVACFKLEYFMYAYAIFSCAAYLGAALFKIGANVQDIVQKYQE
jgi:hypothetical protein